MKTAGKILLAVFLFVLAMVLKTSGLPGWGITMGICAAWLYYLLRGSRKPAKIPTAKEAEQRLKATREAAQQFAED